MVSVKNQQFEGSEELFIAIEEALVVNGIQIINREDHSYLFNIVIASDNQRIGRLSIYYNKFFACTTVKVIEPVEPIHFETLSAIFPIKNKNVIDEDPYMRYLTTNYQVKVVKIHESEAFVCYEITQHSKTVWMKIVKDEVQCHYLKGDAEFFDYLQYVIEDDLSHILKRNSIDQIPIMLG